MEHITLHIAIYIIEKAFQDLKTERVIYHRGNLISRYDIWFLTSGVLTLFSLTQD